MTQNGNRKTSSGCWTEAVELIRKLKGLVEEVMASKILLSDAPLG
jgi:hypothetical protein